jgi:phosphopantothenoylcysteine decarboxylase/phosphopantothenate--cysteine ligase
MGFAIAAGAWRRGARVTLVAGPTQVEPPEVGEIIRVRSAAEMHAAVMAAAPRADVIVMAAAIADYTPAHPTAAKIAKGEAPLTLTFERTQDILSDLGRLPKRLASGSPILVGFAAETGNAVSSAREKRARKNVDLMVANDVSRPDAGFDVHTNEVTLISDDGEEAVPLDTKDRVAATILDRIERILTARSSAPARA